MFDFGMTKQDTNAFIYTHGYATLCIYAIEQSKKINKCYFDFERLYLRERVKWKVLTLY